MPERPADYVCVSHEHFDHNFVAGVSGRTSVVRGCTSRQLGPAPVQGVLAHHDTQGGARKGHVTIFCVQSPQGLRICHLGDTAHPLEAEQLAEIGACDVVMVPVGGGESTLDASLALQVLAQLKPKLVLPMHFRTPFLSRALFPIIDGLEPFLKKAQAHYKIERASDGVVRLDGLPARPTVLVVPHLY